ncbi:hypothetical protein D9615_007514 [Tricholomella constricta]|uniref:Uncharacterized protein n=1 Tax=Tricholomella constricta TaxID=117010 RepID=A0A8H5M1S0_9AGAR|nr:hypothetical protein D9615_007514 [Tricholomella constricta]
MSLDASTLHPNQPLDPIWKCDPVFGIVHSFGCQICPLYMRHIATASHSDANDLSFQLALKERDSQYTVRYLHGVCEGGRLVQEEMDGQTADLLTQYRVERDEALALADRRSAELLIAQEELLQVKEQFRALRVLFDELADFSATETSSLGEEILPGPSPALLKEDTGPLESTNPPRPPPLTLPTPPPSPLLKRSHLHSPPSTPDAFQITPHLPAAHTEGSQVPETGDDDITSVHSEETAGSVTHAALFAEDAGETPAFNQLSGIVERMDAARKGNEQALLEVTKLYAAACTTPIKDRSTTQQLLILEWMNARPSLLTTPPTSGDPPALQREQEQEQEQEPETAEIFVDSSASWGIGFSYNGRWLAWKLKPGWNAQGRDNNWGEMVAVELGLHVAIAAGLRSQSIVVRSDNWGVVRALITGKSKHARQPEIIRNIGALRRRYGIDLIPVWVSTTENLADKPSRGKFPPRHLIFPVSVPLPAHLSPFLYPPVPLSALSH